MPKVLDWVAIRKDYEDYGLSFEVIGLKHDCSSVSVRNRAKTEEWERKEIAGFEDEEVETPAAIPEIPEAPEPSIERITAESALHRTKCIVARLLDELESTTAHIGQMQAWIKGETAGDRDGHRRRAMYNAVSMGNRAVMVKNLTSALKTMCEVQIVVDRELASEEREREKKVRKKTEDKYKTPTIDIDALAA